MGFEPDRFRHRFAAKEIAENPSKHGHLITFTFLTCASILTPINSFFRIFGTDGTDSRGSYQAAVVFLADVSSSALHRTGTTPGNFPKPCETLSIASPVSCLDNQLVLEIRSVISFFETVFSSSRPNMSFLNARMSSRVVKIWAEPGTGCVFPFRYSDVMRLRIAS